MVGNDVRSNEGAASAVLVGTVQTLLLLWEKWGVPMINLNHGIQQFLEY